MSGEGIVERIIAAASRSKGIAFKVHRMGKATYAKSFFGKEFVDYLISSRTAQSPAEAVELANVFFICGIIQAASKLDNFVDGRILYFMNEDNKYYKDAQKVGDELQNNSIAQNIQAWLKFASDTEVPIPAQLAVYDMLLAKLTKKRGDKRAPKPEETDKELAQVYVRRAELFFIHKDLNDAEKDVNKAIELDPQYARSYLIKARLAFVNKKIDDVMDNIKKVLERDPTNNEANAMSQQFKGQNGIPNPHAQSNGVVDKAHAQHGHGIGQWHGTMQLELLTNHQKWNVPPWVLNRAQAETKGVNTIDCRERLCMSSRMDMDYVITEIHNPQTVLTEARDYLQLYFRELKLPLEKYEVRMKEVEAEIKQKGTYWQTLEELTYGAKVAWRNASRCINRIQWARMEIIDCRKVNSAEEIYEKLMQHLRFATNRGNVITTASVFAPDSPGKATPKIWNSQILRYAAYVQPDGSIIGDPRNVEQTEDFMRLGWRGEGTMFDLLPICIEMPGEEPKLFPIPPDDVLVIKMTHPTFSWWADMKLQWIAVPLVSDIGLSCGGVKYSTLPFNGWFMGSELSRNLGDPQRYNLLPTIATSMGLDPNGPPSSLWQEKANVELNVSILYSFQKARVSMVDHHTAAAGFMTFWEAENAAGRPVPSDWVWLVPPCAGSVSPLFHLEMLNWLEKPAYYPAGYPGKNYDFPKSNKHRINLSLKMLCKLTLLVVKFMKKAWGRRHVVRILYATETGNSERYAQRTAKFLRRVANVNVTNMEDYDINNLEKEEVVLSIASTFGSGDAPSNGAKFKDSLGEEGKFDLSNVRFGVFGLGSTLYTEFAAFGAYIDKRMAVLGGTRVCPLEKGDEIAGSELSFKKWIGALWTSLSPLWGITAGEFQDGMKQLGLASGAGVVGNKYKSHYELVPTETKSTASLPANAPHNRSNPLTAKLKENVELFKTITDKRSTRKFVLDIGDSLKYYPGDHLAILPLNMPELVEEVITLLKIKDPEAVFNFKPVGEQDSQDLPLTKQSFTLREAFSAFIDITSPPKPDLVDIFYHFAVHPGDKLQLQLLASGGAEYEEWLQKYYPTLPEFLKMFNGVNVPLELLIEKLPAQQVRFYSISSSQKAHPTEVHLTAAIVSYTTPSGALHHGVASNYLARSTPGTPMKVFVRTSDFRLPTNPSTPVIMIGPGTGLAPFRSFWQERSKLESLGPAVLFFGCRSRGHDYIYSEEMEAAKAKGHLSDVHVAFSRETSQKVYVQDLLKKEASQVLKLVDQGGIFYVCGDVTMSKDVEDTFSQILQDSGMSKLDAEKQIKDMMKQKRYQTDVFGVTLHVKKTTTEQKEIVMTRTFRSNSSFNSLSALSAQKVTPKRGASGSNLRSTSSANTTPRAPMITVAE